MNTRSLQTILLVICLVGLVYMLIVLQKDGSLQRLWSTLTSGAFGGYPL